MLPPVVADSLFPALDLEWIFDSYHHTCPDPYLGICLLLFTHIITISVMADGVSLVRGHHGAQGAIPSHILERTPCMH